jgi:hypothetical protein
MKFMAAIILMAALLVWSAASARETQAPVAPKPINAFTAADISKAIEKALTFIRTSQNQDGSFNGSRGPQGATALAALAMLAAGQSPVSDEPLKKALEYLLKNNETDHIYTRAIQANVWEYALRKCPNDERFKKALKIDFEWLMESLGNKEGWRYNKNSRDWDNSCTQYGVLGIWAAVRAGFNPGDAFWKKMSDHFLGCRRPDGGWAYQNSGGSTPNMTTAGLATMFLIFDQYHGKAFYSASNPRAFTSGDAAAVLSAIDNAMNYLGTANAQSKADAYYLYGIERTGVASGRKFIGVEDWFKTGAAAVLNAQNQNGSLPLGRWGNDIERTSMCVLFLVYGGAPVVVNKLQFGEGEDWNLNPRDAANLVKNLWSIYERPLNWETVRICSPIEEFEAPILFLSGSKTLNFTDEEIAKLRAYILRGGTIFAEPADRSAEFAASMLALVEKMFPKTEYPSCKLEPLAENHPVYTVSPQKWAARPELLGAGDGARTFFFLSKSYLAADWQMDNSSSDAFKLGMNLLLYSADSNMPEGKFSSIIPDCAPAAAQNSSVTVARIKFTAAGEPMDWARAENCWNVFAPYFKHVTGADLKYAGVVNLATDNTDGIDVLHLCGRCDFKLTEPARDALKKFAARGGIIFADSYSGSPAFAAAVKRELEAVLGKISVLDENSSIVRGEFTGGTSLSTGAQYTLAAKRILRDAGAPTGGHNLQAICIGDLPAVIFSAFDVSGPLAGIHSCGSAAYSEKSARQIAVNILSSRLPAKK